MIRYLLASLVAACFGSGIVLVAMAAIGNRPGRARDVRASPGRGRGRVRADVRASTGRER